MTAHLLLGGTVDPPSTSHPGNTRTTGWHLRALAKALARAIHRFTLSLSSENDVVLYSKPDGAVPFPPATKRPVVESLDLAQASPGIRTMSFRVSYRRAPRPGVVEHGGGACGACRSPAEHEATMFIGYVKIHDGMTACITWGCDPC